MCIFMLYIGRNLDENPLYTTPKPLKYPHERLRRVKFKTFSNETNETPGKSVKKILFYTPFFHMTDWEFGFGQKPFKDFKCPVTNCFTTNNRSLLSESEFSSQEVFERKHTRSDFEESLLVSYEVNFYSI